MTLNKMMNSPGFINRCAAIGFSLLMLLSFGDYTGMAVSVVPGWHTPILPPFAVVSMLVSVLLVIVTIIYWKLSRVNTPAPGTTFVLVHFILSMPGVVALKFPIVESLNSKYITAAPVLVVSLFFVMQLCFFVTIARRVKSQKNRLVLF